MARNNKQLEDFKIIKHTSRYQSTKITKIIKNQNFKTSYHAMCFTNKQRYTSNLMFFQLYTRIHALFPQKTNKNEDSSSKSYLLSWEINSTNASEHKKKSHPLDLWASRKKKRWRNKLLNGGKRRFEAKLEEEEKF